MHLLRLSVVAVLLVLFGAPVARAQETPASIEAMLEPITEDRAFRSFRSAIHVVHVDSGETVFERGETRALIPASTMKAVTAAAALRTLGPAYRFETAVLATGPVDASGVLQGDLVVRGEGDPSLVVEKLWKLVADLKAEGVERVAGNVIYDDSHFEGGPRLVGWDKQDDIERGPAYFAPVGALSVNHNAATLVIRPGAEVGKPARARLDTSAGDYITVDTAELLTVEADAHYRLNIDRIVGDDGKMTFALQGTIPIDEDTRRFYRSVEDPTRHFIGVFEELMRKEGIRVDGRHKRGTVAEAEELVSLRSRPLTVILMDMNKFSNNFMAEQVLRAMGAEVHGVGSNETGIQVITDYLVSLGLEPKEFTLVNGSGLSRSIRLRPTHLTAVLLDMVDDPRVGAEFRTSLSIAGTDGTLWRRLDDQPGKLRGKTGTVDGVHCLAGYMEGADGELYAFAFLANDIRGGTSKVKGIHDQLARKIFETSWVPHGAQQAP